VRPIDADETVAGNQGFSTTLVPAGMPFTAPGQISWLHELGVTSILLNTDADPLPRRRSNLRATRRRRRPGS
jgi:hypothetical protein